MPLRCGPLKAAPSSTLILGNHFAVRTQGVMPDLLAATRRKAAGLSRFGYEQVRTTWPEILTLPGSCRPLNWNEPEASGLTISVATPVGNAKT